MSENSEAAAKWPRIAASAIPLCAAVLSSGNGMGFYDSPELAASGAGLGITHPPGHPLWVAIAAIISLVPVGAIPFRIALGEALLLGVIGRIAFELAQPLVVNVAGKKLETRYVDAIALAASITATVGIGVFRQATRVEVYALAGVLALIPLAMASGSGETARRARFAVLAVGLGTANHHFIELTAVPLALWVLLQRWRESHDRPWRSIVAWSAMFTAGLCAYVLLPLRANAPSSLPRPHTLSEVIDVASARVFAKNTGLGVPGTAGVRALDVLDWLGETITPVGLLFALGGFYLALRGRDSRRLAVRLLLLVMVVSIARGYLGFTRDNPDAAGYLVPAMVALGVVTAAFAAGSWRAIHEAPPEPRGPSRGARVLLIALLVGGPIVLPAWLLYRSWHDSGIDRANAPNTLALAVLAPIPPRGILFAYEPHTIFSLRYAMLVEGERPDVTVVPVPLLGYPGMVAALLNRDRALVPVMEQYLLRPDEGIAPRLLSSLAVLRPVAIEMDPRNIHANVAWMLPHGLIAEVTAQPTTLAAVRGASAAHFTLMDQLSAQLGREPDASTLVNETLLWRDYVDAMFLAERGARAEARRSVARGLQIDAESRELIELRDRLAVDPRP